MSAARGHEIVPPKEAPHCCEFCGNLGWTVKRHGRVTHKEACPHRDEPYHQGAPNLAARVPPSEHDAFVKLVEVLDAQETRGTLNYYIGPGARVAHSTDLWNAIYSAVRDAKEALADA